MRINRKNIILELPIADDTDDNDVLALDPEMEECHEYYVNFMNSLCDTEATRSSNNTVQYSSPVGLARLTLVGFIFGFLVAIHGLILVLIYYYFQNQNPHSGCEDHELLLRKKLCVVAEEGNDNNSIIVIKTWCFYVLILSIYHCLEFLVTARYNPSLTSYDSFLVNQSKAYVGALLASVVEYWFEAWFFSDSIIGLAKSSSSNNNLFIFQIVALVVIAIGQSARTLAMIQAGPSFTHLIQYKKRSEHTLIKTGIFRYLRHPSYFGWFYWSISTQILLANPICAIGYLIAGWTFFRRRIVIEENTLEDFFPNDYPTYKASTFIGIPFLMAFLPSNKEDD
jgi:protein-S-isoprenylcysteine O-methyltransferase